MCPGGGSCVGGTCCYAGNDRYACCPVGSAVCCSNHRFCCPPDAPICDIEQGRCLSEYQYDSMKDKMVKVPKYYNSMNMIQLNWSNVDH